MNYVKTKEFFKIETKNKLKGNGEKIKSTTTWLLQYNLRQT